MDELAIKVVMSTSFHIYVCLPKAKNLELFSFLCFLGFNDQRYGHMVDEIITDGWLMISSKLGPKHLPAGELVQTKRLGGTRDNEGNPMGCGANFWPKV